MASIKTFLNNRIKSFGYAFTGIATLFKSEANAQVHLLALVIIVLMGLWLGLYATEWCLILICMALVLCAEAINTALEALTDLVSPDPHPLAGKAKDVAAGGVLLSVIFCGIVWGIIFLPKIFEKFGLL